MLVTCSKVLAQRSMLLRKLAALNKQCLLNCLRAEKFFGREQSCHASKGFCDLL